MVIQKKAVLPRLMKMIIPLVKPTQKPIEIPPEQPIAPQPQVAEKKVPPPPAELQAMFGDWQTIVIGPPKLTRQIFLVHNYKGVWHIYYTFLDGDKIVGTAHGENASF